MLDFVEFILPNYWWLIGAAIISISIALITAAIEYDCNGVGISVWLIPLIIIGAGVVIGVVGHTVTNSKIKTKNIISITNAINSYEESCGEHLSNINAYICERDNTLINLADIIQSYNEYESNTLIEIVKAKSNISYQAILSRVNEKYPVLKSIDNYSKLIEKLNSTEANIRNARVEYNKCVKNYNAIIGNPIYMNCISEYNINKASKVYLETDVVGEYQSKRILSN